MIEFDELISRDDGYPGVPWVDPGVTVSVANRSATIGCMLPISLDEPGLILANILMSALKTKAVWSVDFSPWPRTRHNPRAFPHL